MSKKRGYRSNLTPVSYSPTKRRKLDDLDKEVYIYGNNDEPAHKDNDDDENIPLIDESDIMECNEDERVSMCNKVIRFIDSFEMNDTHEKDRERLINMIKSMQARDTGHYRFKIDEITIVLKFDIFEDIESTSPRNNEDDYYNEELTYENAMFGPFEVIDDSNGDVSLDLVLYEDKSKEHYLKFKNGELVWDNINIFIDKYFNSFITKLEDESSEDEEGVIYKYKINNKVKKFFRTIFFGFITFSEDVKSVDTYIGKVKSNGASLFYLDRFK